jgi:hypothetical protein
MNESKGFSRAAWVSACDFHPADQSQVLKTVLDLVAEAVARHKVPSECPVVLLDLDSTLYEVSPRTLNILEELRAHPDLDLPPHIQMILSSLSLERIGYTLPDTFSLHGIRIENEPDSHTYLPKLKELWKERFFSDPYLVFDRPYPGAAEFVQELHRLGTEIVYLTGREARRMREGTMSNLSRDGFPWGFPNTHLLMKENTQWDDLYHKRVTALSIRKWGNPIASFENEPRNIVGFMELFPAAMHVFVETVCSELPAGICKGLYRIRDFKY